MDFIAAIGEREISRPTITAERLAPAGEQVARGIGAAAIGAGLFLIARAVGIA